MNDKGGKRIFNSTQWSRLGITYWIIMYVAAEEASHSVVRFNMEAAGMERWPRASEPLLHLQRA